MSSHEYTPRVLIVDDEPILREMLADALRDDHLDISLAGSGKEALELAESQHPDIIITDLCLGDCSGLEVIDNVRKNIGDVPTVVITGYGDAQNLSEASRRRPLELMTKPLNLHRLRKTVTDELDRLANEKSHDEQEVTEHQTDAAKMANQYRELSQTTLDQKKLIEFQNELIQCHTDDDVFRNFFRSFVRQSGAICGAALVCDANAELRIAGRFGVPRPDGLKFCKALSDPLVDVLLADPKVQIIDAMDEPDSFDEAIQRYLPGITLLVVPLIPAPGEMIGMVMLYRKGEQPILPEDVKLAKALAYPTALAVRRND